MNPSEIPGAHIPRGQGLGLSLFIAASSVSSQMRGTSRQAINIY